MKKKNENQEKKGIEDLKQMPGVIDAYVEKV